MVKAKETSKKEVKKAKKEGLIKGYKTEMEIEAELEKESERIRLERLNG